MELVVHKKTGYKILNPNVPVIIRDIRGNIFYDNSRIRDKSGKFNMPKGVYRIVSGVFEPMEKPVNYPLFSLPDNSRSRKNPIDFDIYLGDNPHKCSVFWDFDLILFDKALFQRWPLYVIYFVYGHEIGHRFYGIEEFADWYAHNFMIQIGFNPSQIGLSPLQSLSERQRRRMALMVYKLIQTHAKRPQY